MADTVTSYTNEDGRRWLVKRFTNVSDGTGETNVTKVNATTEGGIVIGGNTIYPGVNLKIVRIQYDCKGMGLRIQWHATTNQDILVCGNADHQDFRPFGGISNPGTASLTGATGSIDFTTINAASGASYSVVLWMTKGIPQK